MVFERHFVATTESGLSVPAVRYSIDFKQWIDSEPLPFVIFESQELQPIDPKLTEIAVKRNIEGLRYGPLVEEEALELMLQEQSVKV